MATAANQQPYVTPWGYGPMCGGNGLMNRQIVGKPAWIALMVLGFIFWWPVGLGLLLYMTWTGRMGGSSHVRTSEADGRQGGGWGFWSGGGRGGPSGNRAFDEYRAETLRRLEEEQQEFSSFLERLRVAKDKAEFDQFMAERRRRTEPSTETGQT